MASCARRYLLPLLLPALLLAVVLSACSTNKNTAVSRKWQAFTTRYNVYYNGSEHYIETLKEMEKSYQDDYTRMVLMHPAEAKGDNKLPQPSGDFKRTIEKMQKAIQLHSITKKPKKRSSNPKDKAFRAREEFNPFLHNAWLMMGRAQYFNGDFLGAASTFFYISRHFTWLPEVVDEAKLWQARSYLALDWLYEAENILTHIKPEKLANKKLMELYDFDMADFYVRSKKDAEAVAPLQRAAKVAKGSQKGRLYFLLGQVQTRLGDKKAAYSAYREAGKGAGADYRAKFNARIKQSEVYTGTNISGEVRALRGMTKYERNKEFLDQIYYAIGNLYLSRGDTLKAEQNYALAIEKSTRGGIDKALAQLALGRIYFDRRDYVKAQPLFSEAISQLSDNYPDYKLIKKRSDVLDELSTYSGNVQLQDSLLTLSKMTAEEQMKVCERLAKEYSEKKKKEEEEAKLEEAKAQAAAQGQTTQNQNSPTQFSMNNDKSWYFYNTQTKNQGKTEFQRRWGARKLEDDWRRRNKNTFSLDEPESDSGQTAAEGEATDSITPEEQAKLDLQQDPEKPEYYLKDIPKTPEEIATCNDIIQEGLYNIGVILKDKLEDFPASRADFNDLLSRYPDNVYRLDVYYNMYLMAVRDHLTAEAEKWRQLIITDFPESPYGIAMQDPNYFENLRRMDQVQEQMYEQAYTAYLDNNNARVRSLTADMEKEYPLSKILPKFVFLDALTYATDKNEEKFKERLQELLQKWPDTDMTEMASDMLGYLNKGRKLNSSGGNTRGMLWDTRLTADADAAAPGSEPAHFDMDPNKPQLLVLAFPLDSIHPNYLLYEVARFNFSSFVVKDFDLEQMNFGNVGLLIVKGFANVKEVEHYRTVLARYTSWKLPECVRPIMISAANFQTLLTEGRSFEEYFQAEQEATIKAKEALENPPAEAEDGEAEAEEAETEEGEEGEPAEEQTPAEEEEAPEEEEELPAGNPVGQPRQTEQEPEEPEEEAQ